MRTRPQPIRHVLLDRGIKLVELARETGDSDNYELLRRAVNGETTVRQDMAERAALALGLPVDFLFRPEDIREPAVSR